MTFADTYSLRSNLANFKKVADAVDALLASHASAFTSGNINTTSASFVDYTSSSAAITVASGETCLILGHAALSLSGGSNNKATFRFTKDGSALGQECNVRGVSPGATDGVEQFATWWYWDAPSVGAHTYKIQWKTSSGTLYSANSALVIIALQTGA